MNRMRSLRSLFVVAGMVLLVGACTAQRVRLPEPLQLPPAKSGERSQTLVQAEEERRPTSMQRANTPQVPGTQSAITVSGLNGESLPPLQGGAVNVNIEGMPIPAFINEFFGTILGTGFQMDPAVSRMSDLVTLRTPGPQSPQNFYRLATQILRSYGVATEYSSGLVFFRRASDTAGAPIPLIISGRALPDVPISHRTIFQLVELQSVRVYDITNLLRQAFKTDALVIQDDVNRNAVILSGKPEAVRQALEAIKVFDRPLMRGRSSARLEPAFVGSEELAKRLVEVLTAEGYGASLYAGSGATPSTAVLVLPLNEANTVLVFASDRAVLEHAVEWARSIDRPNPVAGNDGLFYYTVKNTQAKGIADTINGLRSNDNVRASPREAIDGSQVGNINNFSNIEPVNRNNRTNNAPAGRTQALDQAPTTGGGSLANGTLTVDEPRNALIFQGAATDWGRLLPLVEQMDRAPRQVMIEVTVAEVTLSNNEEFGIAWLAKNDIGKFNGNVSSGTLGGLGGTGLSYLLDIGGQTRASLKALAGTDRINVLSTPRLMVKSGEEANFDVGTEVPTITSQSTSPLQTGGTSNILQTVQYRKTGILLNIKPVVYSDDRVDLEIRQEVSEALPVGADAAVSSPAIFNRSYSTSLSLKDGSAILIAGLMSQRRTDSNSGIPYLKDIPLLGNAFKSTKRNNNKTELVLMIVPYIIETDTQAEELTRSLSQRFELIDLPNSPPPEIPVVPSVPVKQP